MLRPSLTTAAIALLGVSAMAQGDLKSRVQPITAPIKNAGVYHVATGTWTRNGHLSNLTGPDTIYNNSCATAYFGGMISGEKWEHRSRVPTTQANGAPTTFSAFYGAPRRDEAPGCATSYLVNGFEVLYCSSRLAGLGTIDWDFNFANSYTACGAADMVPTSSFNVTGLPGGTTTGAQNCWIVGIDLDAVSASFTLQADGDGTYAGPSNVETFGYSQGPTTLGITAAMDTGPVMAGDFTWTGGTLTGVLTPCTGTDGTIWDNVINLAEEGTGMSSQDFFRDTGTAVGAPSGPGCYFFGGAPHADFYLKLFAAPNCPPSSPMVQNCIPGSGGIIACPCSNPAVAPGLGCNNFGAGPTASGLLDASGVASLANDTVVLNASGENNTSLNVFFAGSGTLHPTGLPQGAGVRCVTTSLKRLYTAGASGGAVSRPGMADLSISARSAALAVPISAGETRHYFNVYRDPAAAGPCGNTASTVNTTNTGSIAWSM
jgi:hypothetical protein